jgi:hypothetical protein
MRAIDFTLTNAYLMTPIYTSCWWTCSVHQMPIVVLYNLVKWISETCTENWWYSYTVMWIYCDLMKNSISTPRSIWSVPILEVNKLGIY